MKKHIQRLILNPFFSSSLIMIIGSNLTSLINYIYHVFMARFLQPASYGELAALFSLVGLIGTVPSILGPVIIRYVAASKDHQQVSGLIKWFDRKLLLLGFIIFLLIMALTNMLISFLRIDQPLYFWLAGASFILIFPALLYKGVLQGLMRFDRLVITQIFENLCKIIIGVGLVYFDYGVGGAMVGLFLSAGTGLFVARNFAKDYIREDNQYNVPDLKFIKKYSGAIMIQAIALTSFYTSDLLLVKHFLSAYEAGTYAALSRLAQIIFFAAGPIGSVMFAMASRRQSQGQGYNQIFYYSFGLTGLIAAGVVGIYWLFPELAINLLYGDKYLSAAFLLVKFGIFMSLFTLATLSVNFFLSINKTRVVFLAVVAALIQVVGIWFIHNSLESVLNISIMASGGLLVSLIGYFFYTKLHF